RIEAATDDPPPVSAPTDPLPALLPRLPRGARAAVATRHTAPRANKRSPFTRVSATRWERSTVGRVLTRDIHAPRPDRFRSRAGRAAPQPAPPPGCQQRSKSDPLAAVEI